MVFANLSTFWKQNRAPLAWVLVALVIGAGIGAIVISTSGAEQGGYTSDFIYARDDAARVSQEIVRLTATTNAALKQANILDIQGSRDQALSLIAEAKSSNTEAARKADILASDLKRLTLAIDGLPEQPRKKGYEAIATEFWLVGEFANYTGYIDTFLSQLTLAVSDRTSDHRALADRSLATVNLSADRINRLNSDFLQRMAAFDRAMQ